MKEESTEEEKIMLPTRPKGAYAEKFRHVQLLSNHYKVSFKGSKSLYIISSKFDPLISDDNRTYRNRVYEAFSDKIRTVIQEPVFTGMTIMTAYKPKFDDEIKLELNYDGKDFTLKLRLVRTMDFTNSSITDSHQKFIITNFFNNYLRNKLKELNFAQIGKTRKFFDTSKKIKIEGTNLTLYEGYAANFCFLETGLYLKVDAASKIVRNETVLDFIDNLYSIHEGKSKEEKRAAIQENLVNKTVMTNYGTSRCYKIEAVIFDESIETYKLEEGTLMQYYEKKYNIKIRKPKQPLLKVADKKQKTTLLIPQLCLMTGLSDDMDERKRREVSNYTIKPASHRKERIEDLIRRINRESKTISPQQLNDRLGISIEDRLHKVEAKTLPFPNLQLGDRNAIDQGRQANFRLFDKPLYNTSIPMKLLCLAFREFNLRSLQNILYSTAKSFRLDLEYKGVDLGEFSSRKGLEVIEDELRHRAKKEYNMFMIVLPNQLKTSYKKLKKLCITDLKINSQIVTQNTLQRKQFNSIATKVLLQMAAKIGNTLWVPRPQETFRNTKIMLVGVDSSADKNSNGKIIGFCASLNESHTKYFSSTIVQKSNSSVLEKMKQLICKSIKAFTDDNRDPPDEIIVLRDGCSFGQIDAIHKTEVNDCIEASRLVKNKTVSLTYIIIDKKVSQKFFSSGNNGVNNPSAGTLINSDLVSEYYDFYLISQFSNRGTTVPTYYKVIYTDSKMEEGKLQQLVYHQCYNYVNWTGSIKIPAPVQYAKKLCSFASQYVSDNVDELSSKLYFI